MPEPGRRSFFNKVVYALISFVLVLTVISILSEITIRLVVKIPAPPYDNKEMDEVLGWRSKAGYRFQTNTFYDNKGGTYPVDLSFTKHGFRRWDDAITDSVKPAVLFIGDSYVESLQVSDKDAFYAVFGDSLDYRIFAAGTSGYGTTQELLLLRQFIDSIRPQFVVLEMCTNDFPDNYWQLEKETGYKVGLKRPYLNLANRIEYHHPDYWLDELKKYSLLYYVIAVKAQNALIKMHLLRSDARGDRMIESRGLQYDKYALAYRLTGNTLMNIKGLLDKRGIKLLVFIADDFEPTTTDFKRLCAENNIDVIESIAGQVRAHDRLGETVHTFDGFHWNPKGQKIVANELIKYFKSKSVEP